MNASPQPLAIGRRDSPRPTFGRQVEIINALGLHLRAAERMVRLANQFGADVRVAVDGRWVNGRSILDLLTLAAPCGARLELEAEGPGAEAAVEALAALIGRGFEDEDP
jgi:phosphocarrier protein